MAEQRQKLFQVNGTLVSVLVTLWCTFLVLLLATKATLFRTLMIPILFLLLLYLIVGTLIALARWVGLIGMPKQEPKKVTSRTRKKKVTQAQPGNGQQQKDQQL